MSKMKSLMDRARDLAQAAQDARRGDDHAGEPTDSQAGAHSPDPAEGGLLSAEAARAVTFNVLSGGGYYYPQVEAFHRQVVATLAHWENSDHDLRTALHHATSEVEDLRYQNSRLRIEIEAFRVQGDPLVNADGTYRTESQQDAAQRVAEMESALADARAVAAQWQSAAESSAEEAARWQQEATQTAALRTQAEEALAAAREEVARLVAAAAADAADAEAAAAEAAEASAAAEAEAEAADTAVEEPTPESAPDPTREQPEAQAVAVVPAAEAAAPVAAAPEPTPEPAPEPAPAEATPTAEAPAPLVTATDTEPAPAPAARRTTPSAAELAAMSEIPDGVDLPGTGEAAITYVDSSQGAPLSNGEVPLEVYGPELNPALHDA